MAHQDTTSDVQGPSYMNAGPLYAFSLPQELLQIIQLRSPFGTASDVAPENEATDLDAEDPDNKAAERSDGSALRCSLCGIARFESISDQRAHFSSDWHRYNIKRSLSDKPAVKEEEWDSLLEGMLHISYRRLSCLQELDICVSRIERFDQWNRIVIRRRIG